MGGKVLWVCLFVALLGMGCDRQAPKEPSPDYSPKVTTVTEKLKVFRRCNNETEFLDLKNKCFESIEKRDKTIEELKERIRSLQDELKYANENADDWRRRYNEYQCD